MKYTEFKTLTQVEEILGVNHQKKDLFPVFSNLEVSDYLEKSLNVARRLPVQTEKSRCEWIVAPILRELRERNDEFFTIFSGERFEVQTANIKLTGECDFILSKEYFSLEIKAPIIEIVEAKRNDMEIGLPQCAAQMFAAQKFNEKNGSYSEIIYGCVTTGTEWKFLKLTGKELIIDSQLYHTKNIGELLAVFQFIIDFYKANTQFL